MIAKLKSLKNHQGFMKYFKNTSWLFAERILRMAVGLFIGVWVARYLGPEQFGLYSYAGSFVGLFTAIAALGLDGIVVRELVKDESKRDKLIGTAFFLKLIGAIFTLIILFIATQFTSNDTLTNALIFIIASSVIFQSFNVVDFYFQAKVLSKFVVFANVIMLFIGSIVKIALILNEAELIYFAYAVLFESIILALGFIYFYSKQKELPFASWRFDKNTAKSLLTDSWPLVFSGMVLMIQARIDQVMLKEMIDTKTVGFYSTALLLIEVVAFMPMIIKNSLYPSIQKAKKHSLSLYQYRLLNFYRLNFLLFLIVAIPIFLFAEQLVILLFGVEYQPAGILLAFMSIRLFFTNLGVARGVYITIENLMKFSLLTMIIGTIVNIALNYLWIPVYQGIGAILATIISFFVTVFLIDIFYSKTKNNVFLQIKSIITFYKINFRS